MDLGGTSTTPFPFDHIGATASGRIVSMDEVQQTDLDTGEPAAWPDGRPKMMFRVVIETELRDPSRPDDNGHRALYLRGSRKPESRSSLSAVIGAALSATGKSAIDIGGFLTLTYIGDGERSQRAFNPPKHYRAEYVPPETSLELTSQPVQESSAAGSNGNSGVVIGTLDGKPITPTILAAMDAAGVDIATLPGFVPA